MSVVEKIDTPEPLSSHLDDLGIAVTTYGHERVFTVDEGQDIKARLEGGHTKNLFLKDKKGALWLVVALGDTKVDLKWLPGRIGAARLSFGKPELLEEVMGVTPGSVTPFALLNDTERRVTVVLDAAMLEHDILNFHPLSNDMTTAIGSGDLVTFIKSLGYDPVTVDFEKG